MLDAPAEVFVVGLPGSMFLGLELSSWQPNQFWKVFSNHRGEVNVHDEYPVIPHPSSMGRLKYIDTVDARSSENTGDWKAAGVVAVWAVVAEDLLALLRHPNIILEKALGQDASIYVAVCVTEEQNLLASRFPDRQLLAKVINEYLSRASIITHASKVSSVLVVDCL